MKPLLLGAIRRHAPILLALTLVGVLSGCAHPISLAGTTAALAGTGGGKVAKGAGLVISDEDRKREVVSPGGGGDKVSYLPYRDLEVGLYLAMSETFERVTRITGPNDPKVKQERLDYVVTPTIATTSFSPSLFTWPPTIFTVELVCKVTDGDGQPVAEVRAFGEGRAEFDEFKSDFSLAAKRAADDALRKLVKSLGEARPKFQ
jgi:hypothetical protein